MEAKEIVIILVAMLLILIIVIATALTAFNKSEMYVYVHNKTGNRYRIVQEGQMKVDGKWLDAVIYVSEKNCEMYVREYNDFVANFKLLSAWKQKK